MEFLQLFVTIPTIVLAITSSESCNYPAPCTAIDPQQDTCLGVTLDYSHTSLSLANDSSTLEEVQANLAEWAGLQGAPRCWDVIQPLLCAVYMPRCNDSRILMYPRELCLKTREPCKIVPEMNGGKWPEFLDCDQPHFTTDQLCMGGEYTSMKFVYNASCMYPLVKTSNEDSYYEDIDGCGIQCMNPLFTEEEHKSLHIFIGIMASLCLISTLITVLTFVIDWKNSKKYPAVIIFYINLCFCIGSIGWLAQFSGPHVREEIVCRRGGTMRLSEPQVGGEDGESASCTAVFFIVYFFMMAGVTWFVILAYSWHVSFKKLQTGSVDDKLSGKIAYFHIIAWALPLICAIIAMSLQKIDGDSLSGICFVGYVDQYARGFLVLFPIILALCGGLFFLLQGVVRLYRMREGSSNVQNNRATAKITATMLRLGIFSVLAFIFVLLTLILHIYDFGHQELWEESFRNFTICQASARFGSDKPESDCELTFKPSLVSIYLNIFAYFGAGVMMSSWTWTKASKDTWKRFFRKLFRLPTNKPVRLKSKHKLIAEAFQQKQQKKGGRKASLDFHTSHDDPLGMKIDLDSVTSAEMSSAWLAAMPKLIKRRGGVAQPEAGTLRRYSDSDIVSLVTSRRTSIDSQISEAEKVMRSRRTRDDHRSHRGLSRVNASDIAAFNAKRRGSNLSQRSIDDLKARLSRKMSRVSQLSDASAQNISLDCEELSLHRQDHYISSKRSSIDTNAAGVITTAQLEELTLATFSVVSAGALIPLDDRDKFEMEDKHRSTKQGQSSSHSSRNSTRHGKTDRYKTQKSSSSGGRKSSGGSSRVSSGKLRTPDTGYMNGALTDDDLSDVSI